MNEDTDHLKRELALKERELNLVLSIDRIRDKSSMPGALFSRIVRLMLAEFRAGTGLFYLINRESGKLELKVVDECQPADHLPLTLDEIREILQGERVVLWTSEEGSALLYGAALPIFMRGEPLGVLLIARPSRPFDDGEIRLLHTAESQIDSAVIQAYMHGELMQRNKELETIYRVDQIRDQGYPFDEMLAQVLEELCTVIRAEMGLVMLYDHAGKRLEMRALTHDDILRTPPYNDVIHRIANASIERGELVCYGESEDTPCSVMCVPLILRGEVIGVFGAVNRTPHRTFTGDDRRLLRAIVSQMDTAILESLERRRLRRVLSRSLDPRVLDRLMLDPNVDVLKGERTRLTVLYADLRGSTRLSQHLPPEQAVKFINAFLGQMTHVLLGQEGTLDKYVGDQVMALFNAPLPQPDHALRAVHVGVEMQASYRRLQEQWLQQDVRAMGLGVGIATGEVIVGEIGCEQRTDYTVIGPAANLGARLCSAAKPGEVLISQATYEMTQGNVSAEALHDVHLKGFDQSQTLYRVRECTGL